MYDAKRTTNLIVSIFCLLLSGVTMYNSFDLLLRLKDINVYLYILIVAVVVVVALAFLVSYASLPSVLKTAFYVLIVLLLLFSFVVAGGAFALIFCGLTVYAILFEYKGTKFIFKLSMWLALIVSVCWLIFTLCIGAPFTYTAVYHNVILIVALIINIILMFVLKDRPVAKTEEERQLYDEILDDLNSEISKKETAIADDILDEEIDHEVLTEMVKNLATDSKKDNDILDDELMNAVTGDLDAEAHIDDEEIAELLKEDKPKEDETKKSTKKTTKKDD